MEQEKASVSPNAASMKNPTDNIAISRNQKPWALHLDRKSVCTRKHVRLLKNSATKSSFLVGDDHQVCYSDVQEEHTE
jgi:hypothetical protein